MPIRATATEGHHGWPASGPRRLTREKVWMTLLAVARARTRDRQPDRCPVNESLESAQWAEIERTGPARVSRRLSRVARWA
jgi:hypothetical protein